MKKTEKIKLSAAFFMPFLVLLVYETIHQGSLQHLLRYARTNPNEFITNYVLIFCLVNVFYVMRRKIYFAMALVWLLFFSLFAYADKVKIQFRGEPIIFTDIYLKNEATDISKYLNLNLSGGIIGFGLLFLALVVFVILLPKQKMIDGTSKIKKRVVSFTSLIVLTVALLSTGTIKTVFGVEFVEDSLKENADTNGLLLGFLLNAKNPEVKIAEDYNENTIQEIVNQIQPDKNVDPEFNPNVIVILSEALWDPTQLQGVEFNQDPISFYRSLTETHSSGTIINPVYGGGTINSELQVLTGLSTEFVSDGASLHKYIDHPVDSMASVLKNQGYNSVAVHTFNGWFYERNRFYKELGFDRFYSLEFFNKPEMHGSFAKDTGLFARVLEEVENSPEQDFIYAPTVEAHGPYVTDQLTEGPIRVTSSMSDASRNILTDYANRIHGFDQALQQLITGLEDLDEPTIVAVYGDHLPMLGEGESVYKEFNYFNGEETYEDFIKKYSTTTLVWDNFSEKNEELRMSGSFLPAYILDLAQKQGSYVTDYLSDLYNKDHSVLLKETFRDREKMKKEEIVRYQNLQYDAVFGENFAYETGNKPKPQENETYVLGEGSLEIKTAGPENATVSKRNPEIHLMGSGFVTGNKSSQMVISVNEQAVTPEKMDGENIWLRIPDKLFEENQKLTVRVLLKDNTNQILTSSNDLTFSIGE